MVQASRHSANGPRARGNGVAGDEPEAVDDTPPPEWLTNDAAITAFRLAVDLLASQRILHTSDLGSLARYCQFLAEWIDLTDDIEAKGHTNENRWGEERARPQVAMRDAIERGMRSLEKAIGLDPAAHMALKKDLANAAKGMSKTQGRGGKRVGGFLNKKDSA